jgi:hypothetical protein
VVRPLAPLVDLVAHSLELRAPDVGQHLAIGARRGTRVQVDR